MQTRRTMTGFTLQLSCTEGRMWIVRVAVGAFKNAGDPLSLVAYQTGVCTFVTVDLFRLGIARLNRHPY
ncbi:MAG: hypothetical protein ACFHXK_10515 [bacterium]